MSGSWLGRIRRWLHAEPPLSGSFDPAGFERLCLEDPKAALTAIARDQRELSVDVERTYEAYQAKLEELATRLTTLAPGEARREARTLRDAQDAIRRTLRRIAASAATARELQLELHEWEARQGEDGPWHADHPDVRAEIIRSELAARGHEAGLRAIPIESSPFRTPAVFSIVDETSDDDLEGLAEPTPDVDLASPDADHLIEAIRQATREVEQWHGVPDPDEHALEQVHLLKTLHAALKRSDREAGMRRDRLAYALRMRPTDD